jgi:hypothetical protein
MGSSQSSVRKEVTVSQEFSRMLDVHPPHTAVHGWRDFFIHIATIVIGLCIAVGIEQTVEHFHHRQQVAETREQLQTEREINIATFRAQTLEVRRHVPLLQRDLQILLYLRQHPGASSSSWPGQFSWYFTTPTYVESAWTSAHESTVLTLMSHPEVQKSAELYSNLQQLNRDSAQAAQLIWRSFSYGVRDQDPAAMSTEQLDAAIQAVTDTLMLYAQMVSLQWNIHNRFPDFSPAPDLNDQRKIAHVISPAKDQAEAQALRKQMLDEIGRIEDKAKDR